MSHIPEKPSSNASKPAAVQTGIGPSNAGERPAERPHFEPRRDTQESADSHHHRRRSSRRRVAARARKQAVLKRWIALGIGVVGVAISATLLVLLVRDDADSPAQAAPPAGEAGPTPNRPLDSKEAIERTRRFVSAESPRELEPLLRPGSWSPEDAFAELDRLDIGRNLQREPMWIGNLESRMLPIEAVALTDRRGDRYLACFVPDAEGEWRIDLDAFLVTCDPPFEEFPRREVEDGVARVIAVRDDVFDRGFSDDSVWACFTLRNPHSETLLYGYTRRDSATMDALEDIHQRDSQTMQLIGHPGYTNEVPMRVTLRLSKTPDTGADQYHIDQVVSDDWVVTDRSFEEVLESAASG